MIPASRSSFSLCDHSVTASPIHANISQPHRIIPTHVVVQELIEAAKRNGGHDNITAALVHVIIPVARPDTNSKATREIVISSE